MAIRPVKRLMVAAVFVLFVSPVLADDAFFMGPKECQECHEAEYDVWKNSPHFKSYKEVHKHKDAERILKAVGAKSMKRSEVCVLCHYTSIQKTADSKAKAKAGPSCESCHGAASNWRDIHNDYGGPKLKAKDEAPAHKIERQANAEKAGMIASRQVYDISASCMRCHGLANPELSADTLAKMLEAGHPIEAGFEVVKYSQGNIRHRFVPPDVTNNLELGPADTARLFIGGQAAAYVAASRVQGKTTNAKFADAQKQRIESARRNLEAVAAQLPEVKMLLSEPSDENGRRLVAAMAGKDLSGVVADLLPKKSDYK